ncbi:MAG: leucine-rich repeat domain-containing protein [Alphaproteobacteria bacterium]|nr:leucine-rich repeat domain-containing protein [Alphaproteobacteria bacterium]
MTQKYILSALLVGIMAPSAIKAATVCPVDECMSCGDDCLAYVTTLKDENNQDKTFDNGLPQQKLTIIGTGTMTTFRGITDTPSGNTYGSTAPWEPYWNTVKEIDISGVENIGEFAFRHFMKVTDVTMDDSVYTIEHGAFNYLPNLQNIKLSDNLTTIGGYAFEYTGMPDLVIPDTVTSIPNDIFIHGSVSALYCSTNQMNLCRQALEYIGYTDEQIATTLKSYEKTGGEYFYNGKFYQSPNDIGTPNYIKKRIYTIDEANKASGKTNTVTIRYR